MKNRQEIADEIIKESKKEIPMLTNYRTGGVFYTFIQVVASFLEKLYSELEQMLPNRFLTTAQGEWLDKKAEELSLKRYPAEKTRGYVIFSRGSSNQAITIAKDKIIASKPNSQGKLFRYKVQSDVILQEGVSAVGVLVEAEEDGAQYNLVGSQITEIITPVTGIDRIYNPTDWIVKAGKDPETDESLRNRCLSLWQGLGGANKQAYASWAKQIPEVEDVRIISTARGLGTVDIIFTKTNNELPDEDLINKVQEIINERKPIATDVLVKAPRLVPVDITADIILLPDFDLTKDKIENIVRIYFAKMKIGDDFEPSALSGFLFGNLEGIKSVVLDNQTTVISELQIASVGRININISISEHQ